jgi:hypothetical protein
MTNPGDIQFDRAEPTGTATPGSSCDACKQPLRDSYYEVNGKVVCPDCRTRLVSHVAAGSFANAFLLGLGAAVLGAGLYFAIELLTGYEFGLVAVVVGLLVGTAVRKASRGAGGWRYQALALALTYFAIVATDGSLIVRELIQEGRHHTDSLPTAAADSSVPQSAPVIAPGGGGDSVATPAATARSPVVAIVVLLGFLIAAPVMIGISSPLHLVIVGFALYQAWKLNRAPAFKIAGPYRLAAP